MMDTPVQLGSLIEMVGPKLDAIGVIEVQEGTWAIVFEGDVIVDVAYQADRSCLTFEVEIGEPPQEKRLAVYEAALIYSGLTDETGGVRIFLDSTEGNLQQQLDYFADGMDEPEFIDVVEAFVEKARTLRMLIARGEFVAEEFSEVQESEPAQGMRV